MSAYFITGTDTEIGKTWVTLALMQAFQDQGKTVVGMKPVASGCSVGDEGLRNSDALQIMQQSSRPPDYVTVNPYAFEEPIAPHIAAARAGVQIDIEKIARHFTSLRQSCEYIFVEGIGGWSVPLGTELMLSDLVKDLDIPVILVVGLRLGCINHTLSSVAVMEAEGIVLKAWVANCIDQNYEEREETVKAIQDRIKKPLLGIIPYMKEFKVAEIAGYLRVSHCLSAS